MSSTKVTKNDHNIWEGIRILHIWNIIMNDLADKIVTTFTKHSRYLLVQQIRDWNIVVIYRMHPTRKKFERLYALIFSGDLQNEISPC